MTREDEVRLEPWPADGLPLLKQLLGDPAMTVHLGGPETEEKLADRQSRYERVAASGAGRMFVVIYGARRAGSVGYWEKEWRGGTVWETGWSVLPEFQGRGVGVAATAQAIDAARTERKHRFVHAFPSVDNAPSNAICRRLGFTLLGEERFEYPPGHFMRCNDWRLDLAGGGEGI